LILSTTSGKFKEKQHFYTSKINVTGLSKSENLQILNKLNKLIYQNIFIQSKHGINKIIAEYNIVEQYSVKKVYPSSFNINIKPTELIAKVSNNSQLLIGANGKLIVDKMNNEILPIIEGEFSSKKFLKFKKNIENSKFSFNRFKTLYFFPSGRWDVLTINNILIKLPRDSLIQSLDLAYKIIADSQFESKNIIDLRVKNQLIIQ
jgi:cell division protein FtsQ